MLEVVLVEVHSCRLVECCPPGLTAAKAEEVAGGMLGLEEPFLPVPKQLSRAVHQIQSPRGR
jgi:hypothetical protein